MTIFLGMTGSGKSTLISFLNGAQLEGKKKIKYSIENKSKGGEYPKIGNSKTSCTLIPKVFGKYIDSAGFDDTEGEVQEIINSYATAQLFQGGKNIKIVLVV